MLDGERTEFLKRQWEQRTDSSKDDLLEWLLKAAWPTVASQKQ